MLWKLFGFDDISNEGAYLTFNSIFHTALTVFSSILESRSNPFLDQPVLRI